MDFPSPLVIQELIDHCLDFLHDSPHDLRACALVCRSWATSAQIHLFSTVSVGYFGFCNNRRSCHLRCSRLFDILDASPRLVRYVKCMEIFLNCVPDETIELISTVPFTHLRRITVAGSCSGVRVISVIQKLLGVGSLRDIAIWASFDSAEDFSQVLQDCSPHVEALYFRHVRVKAIQRHRYTSTYSTTSGPDKIKISTLGLVDALPVNDWLEEPQSPFDFSEVRRLSVYSAQTLPPWKFLTGIEHLEFEIPWKPDWIDLAKLPNLKSIEAHTKYGFDVDMALNIFETVSPENVIQSITFQLPGDSLAPEFCAIIDSGLAGLPLPQLAAVELVFAGSVVKGITEQLPLLTTRNLVRVSSGLKKVI